MTAEEAIAELRERIELIGPVNMMAIEQSQELEERHDFPDQPAPGPRRLNRQTNAAISKIDETTDARFREAFNAIRRGKRARTSEEPGVPVERW